VDKWITPGTSQKECLRHNPKALNWGLRPQTPARGLRPWIRQLLRIHHPLALTEKAVLRGPRVGYTLEELADCFDVAIRRYRTARNQFPQWQAECYEKSLGRNGDFARPLDSRECYHVAKSVSRWTWRKDAEAQARFLARQAARGRKGGLASGVVRRAGSVEEAQPWEAEGISRKTWYRRKSGLIVPGEGDS